MILREFRKDDAQIIAGWIRTEEELYRWSADRFNKYPLSGSDINENYAPQMETGRFWPFTAVDDNGDVMGHFIIRYPRADDDSTVRFGFVIVNPSLRGKGLGKEMLRLGIEYVRENLSVLRIDLGVFENNESARHCYEAAGFTAYAARECVMPIGTWKCIDMEIIWGNVGKAGIDDIDALVKMRLDYLHEDNGSLDDADITAMKKELPNYFKAHMDRDLFAYVVREEQIIVSCAFLLVIEKPMSPAFINGRTGTVLNVYTCPADRHRGYAKMLMKTLLADAKKLQLSVVDLKSTDDGYHLYKSVGFADDSSKYHLMKWKPDILVQG